MASSRTYSGGKRSQTETGDIYSDVGSLIYSELINRLISEINMKHKLVFVLVIVFVKKQNVEKHKL